MAKVIIQVVDGAVEEVYSDDKNTEVEILYTSKLSWYENLDKEMDIKQKGFTLVH